MSIVDAKYRFVWGSCGFPGNSHNSIIFQSTLLWSDIKEGKVLPNFSQSEQGVYVPPIKPYSNAILAKEQWYFKVAPRVFALYQSIAFK